MQDNNVALLWDMDGTIIDTSVSHFKTWRDTLQKHGYDLNRKIYDANFGRNTRTMLPLILGFEPDPELVDEIIWEKEVRFREVAPKEATLIPGVESWLDFAHRNKIPQAIASSGSMDNITTMLRSFDLLKYFDVLIAGADLPAKPKPDVFLKAAQALGQAPQDCIVIEDSLAGLQAAKNAGMTCIAVTTSLSVSETSIADLVLDDFTEPLSEILQQLP